MHENKLVTRIIHKENLKEATKCFLVIYHKYLYCKQMYSLIFWGKDHQVIQVDFSRVCTEVCGFATEKEQINGLLKRINRTHL